MLKTDAHISTHLDPKVVAQQLADDTTLLSNSYGKLTTNCFIGIDGVKWLEQTYSLSSDDAILLLQAIHNEGYIINVEDPFKDFAKSLSCLFVPVFHKAMNFDVFLSSWQKHIGQHQKNKKNKKKEESMCESTATPPTITTTITTTTATTSTPATTLTSSTSTLTPTTGTTATTRNPRIDHELGGSDVTSSSSDKLIKLELSSSTENTLREKGTNILMRPATDSTSPRHQTTKPRLLDGRKIRTKSTFGTGPEIESIRPTTIHVTKNQKRKSDRYPEYCKERLRSTLHLSEEPDEEAENVRNDDFSELISRVRAYHNQVERDHQVIMYIFRRYLKGTDEALDQTPEITPKFQPRILDTFRISRSTSENFFRSAKIPFLEETKKKKFGTWKAKKLALIEATSTANPNSSDEEGRKDYEESVNYSEDFADGDLTECEASLTNPTSNDTGVGGGNSYKMKMKRKGLTSGRVAKDRATEKPEGESIEIFEIIDEATLKEKLAEEERRLRSKQRTRDLILSKSVHTVGFVDLIEDDAMQDFPVLELRRGPINLLPVVKQPLPVEFNLEIPIPTFNQQLYTLLRFDDFYTNLIKGNPHRNFIGRHKDVPDEYMVVSVLNVPNHKGHVAVSNSKSGMDTFVITLEGMEKFKGSCSEKLASYLEEKFSSLFRKIKLNEKEMESFMNDIGAIQEKHRLNASRMRIALLYCKVGQSHPRTEMFENSIHQERGWHAGLG
eukprot:TRINITY_DN4123_c0_g1_i10.p1 TRINITY_DN4123_c0_g1~~TRINITY_DN4123_c0_g1_i10.p1  ORF type:complete len:728 (-),score=132.85 TRINITY_DN4123_c0_g1_i10:1365-3548(-)